jgi:hypothetical protein
MIAGRGTIRARLLAAAEGLEYTSETAVTALDFEPAGRLDSAQAEP